MTDSLAMLKPLTATQYDTVKSQALQRVQKRIGGKPTRSQFKREYAPLFGVLDVLALIVFVSALAISSVHILAHIQTQATLNQHQPLESPGIVISAHDAIVIQQLGMVVLAEFAMLLFMTVWSIERKKPQVTVADLIQTHSMLLLAFMSMAFVIIANIHTGIGLLESIIPPMFTIGIGLRLEHIIVELMTRRQSIDAKYTHALSIWERATHDPTSHPDYQPILKRAIWDRLVSLKDNIRFIDAPADFKLRAVHRELERDNWSRQLLHPALLIDDEDTQPSEPLNDASISNQIDTVTKHSQYIAVTRPVIASDPKIETQCDECGKPIINARHNQRFCNNACRQLAYRKRQNAVVE